jgi:YD repeat-containing protein
MHATYYPDDDILELRFSDHLIVREISQNWNIHISYDAQGQIVEMVILDAQAIGFYPAFVETKQAA